MGILKTLFGSRSSEPVEQGPLFPLVREAMKDVQSYARSHGGTIDLLSVTEEGDVHVRLGGTCRGCPMSSVTLRLGVEERLRTLVPGVRKVVQE